MKVEGPWRSRDINLCHFAFHLDAFLLSHLPQHKPEPKRSPCRKPLSERARISVALATLQWLREAIGKLREANAAVRKLQRLVRGGGASGGEGLPLRESQKVLACSEQALGSAAQLLLRCYVPSFPPPPVHACCVAGCRSPSLRPTRRGWPRRRRRSSRQ